MSVRVITASRPDECRAEVCAAQSRDIAAGESINYGGYQAVTHAGCEPVTAAPGTGRGRGRRSSYRGGKYAYTSSGARMTMSSRRCEDAPCCGCCD